MLWSFVDIKGYVNIVNIAGITSKAVNLLTGVKAVAASKPA
jgi:hypothetical protein